MKNWFWLLIILSLSSFASYGQNANVYQHFSELKGMEDYNGNTNLFYRIYSYLNFPNYSYSMQNNIFLLNVTALTDSLFQRDYSYLDNNSIPDGFTRTVTDYKFWDKDPTKFIVCGIYSVDCPEGFIERFDGRTFGASFSNTFLGKSDQNNSLVYSVADGQLIKSLSGGKNWENVSNFNAISLCPYNDHILFASDGKLYKSTDGGLSKNVVDTIPSTFYPPDVLIYDKNYNYIYRVAKYYVGEHQVNKLLVSNNSGEAFSWLEKFNSLMPIYVSVDNSVEGSLYMAIGKNVFHSTDFGNSFNLLKSFERKLVGIYKKPGSSKLYAATYNTIYEIDGAIVNVVKQIPIDKEIFKFEPLDIGNKWVNKGKFIVPEGVTNFVYSTEIVKDTILSNQENFKQIRGISSGITSQFFISYSYERIDSLTGKVYLWNPSIGLEYQIDDLNINLGDTIYVSPPNLQDTHTSFDSLNFKNIFGLSKENRVYNSTNSTFGYGDRYSLTKDLGLTYRLLSSDQVIWEYVLKGSISKGVAYGDTSFTIVGVNDKIPDQPKEFELSQNYPNPFNPTTTIKYSLPKAGNVKLTVYNAIGSKVATVVNEYKPAGNYSVQFNGSNLASGIYLYRLESGSYSAAKKFVLLK
jgi:hypothetical protein